MPLRLLVVRAEADARRTARALAARGHEAVVAPVIAIRTLDTPPPAGPFDALILTSAHAAAALPRLPEGAPPVFAVGAATASAARAAGASLVHEAAGDGTELAALVARTLPAPARLLHMAGRERKAEPARSLRAAGHAVLVWEVYAAEAAPRLAEPARTALAAGRLDGVLHYSRRSAAILIDLVAREGLLDAFARLAQAGLSEDALEPLRALPRLAAARRPEERFLFEAIELACRPPLRSEPEGRHGPPGRL